MIWLAWQQHRKQALFTLVALAMVAALMIPTGLAMRDTFARLGLPACVRGDAGRSQTVLESCSAALDQFTDRHGALFPVGVLFLIVPALIGLFWGAPLVAREVEHGTHRLVWTQGVSRWRWSLVKFGFVGAVAVVAAAVYGIGMSWWAAPINVTASRFAFPLFDMQGLVPIAYTLFAVALGVFAGTVSQKVLPAMALTLAGFVALRLPITLLVTPHYLAALSRTVPDQVGAFNPNQGHWRLSRQFVDADGNPILPDAEGNMAFGPGTYVRELYQPAERFWLFQSIETGIYIGLAFLLLYLAVRRIRRIA
jgi:ABC-type transport system involved in multi-copper enzyme maturation permease subunit